MPAINVAKSDTFETQRQKINQIGSQIFNISAGGSDLSTGLLKLGDGNRVAPSLAFTNDETLGMYRSDTSTLGFVSNQKKIVDFSSTAFYSYKDLIFRQNKLFTEGTSVITSGSNYDAGSYTEIPILGGTGENATVDLDVLAYEVTDVSSGSGYISGTFFAVDLDGGNGTGAQVDVVVDAVAGLITNAGSGYVPGNYANVPLTGGNGSGAEADILVEGDITITGSVTNAGSGYTLGNYFPEALNTPTQTFVVTANGTTNYIIDGNPQPTLSLTRGNTYRFDVSDSSNATHALAFEGPGSVALDSTQYYILSKGTEGTAGAFIDLVIKPTATESSISYICSNHSGMGGTINLSNGTLGSYGSGTTFDLSIGDAGTVTGATISFAGTGYQANDVLTVDAADVGGTGSGFEYTVSGVTYTGTVTNVTITDSGTNYQLNDNLSANDSDLGGGGGSNFAFQVNTSPSTVSSITFVERGTGYQVGDQLVLPNGVTNVSSTLNGEIVGLASTLGSNTTLTVSSTANIVEGMDVSNGAGDIGVLDANTTVVSIDSPTTITISAAPITPGSANLNFISQNLDYVTVSDSSGIFVGYLVSQSSGNGTLAPDTVVSSIIDGTTIQVSNIPTASGSAVLDFSPAYGNVASQFTTEVTSVGVIDSVTISDGGNGYFEGDELTVNAEDLTQPISLDVVTLTVEIVTLQGTVSASNFSIGDSIKTPDGEVLLASPSTSTQLTGESSATYSNVSTTTNSANGFGATLDISRDFDGNVSTVDVNVAGSRYEIGDILTVLGADVGGSTPTDNITVEVSDVSTSTPAEIFDISSTGGNLDYLVVATAGFSDLATVVNTNDLNTTYTIDGLPTQEKRFSIDGQYTPNLTLYSGSTYSFDLTDSSNANVEFNFSQFRDGRNSPSVVDNITATLDNTSTQVTVTSTAGILAGMEVVVLSGDGTLPLETTVVSVDSGTTLTLSSTAVDSGSATLQFVGTEYTDGVTKTADNVSIKITESTPSPLYIFSSSDENIYGNDNNENSITIDLNNPKTFGSGLLLRATSIESNDVMLGDIETGTFTLQSLEVASINSNAITNATDIASTSVTTPTLNVTEIAAETANIGLSATSFNVNSNVSVNSLFTVDSATGDLVSQGEIKAIGSVNVNDQLSIIGNEIFSSSGLPIALQPSLNQLVEIYANTALGIPVGNTAQRPNPPAGSGDGYIRFNSETNQYEGYSDTNQQWSSLGGVRDLDGNTTILAELTVGANDNTLWFINDNTNTVKFTPEYQEFVNVKKVKSTNVSAPSYVEWTANTPVSLGDYLKYRNNIYEVTTAGTTATSGSEPTHTSGAASNGTSELTWYISAVAPLTFEEMSEFRIDPLGFTDLVVNNQLRLSNNVFSSTDADILISPSSGKKVKVDALTTFVIPVGDSNTKGNFETGSIRFNTDDTQFEGYNGSQWGSLGGVQDADQDTQIKAETSSGSDEDILYFFNANTNTLRVTETRLEFDTIDTINSVTSNVLNVDASTITFDNLATTLDNTDALTTFLFTTKDNLDLGLSVGLNTDPLLRLSDSGDVLFNIGFGTGTPDLVTVFDSNLEEFELADYKITTNSLDLEKGTLNSGNTTIYNTATQNSSKVFVTAFNSTTGDKELIEFFVTHSGSDVIFTDTNNIKTGQNIFDPVFDLDPSNNVRLSFTLSSDLATGDDVNIKIVSHIFKR